MPNPNPKSSAHTLRTYRTALKQFFAWLDAQPRRPFSKALVQEYRAAHLFEQGLSPSSLNLRLSLLRKRAREMAGLFLRDRRRSIA
jgi:site-specific recombinase XerD